MNELERTLWKKLREIIKLQEETGKGTGNKFMKVFGNKLGRKLWNKLGME